jgi:hypothetical protein
LSLEGEGGDILRIEKDRLDVFECKVEGIAGWKKKKEIIHTYTLIHIHVEEYGVQGKKLYIIMYRKSMSIGELETIRG